MSVSKDILVAVENAKKIVITSHRSPDGDSVGSSLALYRVLRKLNKDVVICHPDPAPEFLDWIKAGDKIYTAEQDAAQVAERMQTADLLFALDYNSPDRMAEPMATWFQESKAQKAMIDHHLFPSDFVDFSISRPEVCSTSQLIYEWMEEAAILPELDAHAAAPMYLGLVTDTGSFRFSSVTPKTHEILAHLLELGVDHSAIHEATFDNNRVDKIRLRSYILAERLEIVEKYHVAIISVTMEELSRFHHVKGDTEGLVNQALSLQGVDVAAFFMEKEGGVKISFRSKSHVGVNQLAMEHFNGGGHKNAAGGASDENLEACIQRFKSLLPEYYA